MEGGTSYKEALNKGKSISVLAVGTVVRCVAALDSGVCAVRAMGVVVDYSLRTNMYMVRVFQIWPCSPKVKHAEPSTLTVSGPLDYSAMEHRNPFFRQWAPANAISFDDGEPVFMSLSPKDVRPWRFVEYTDLVRGHYAHFWAHWKLDYVKCIKQPVCKCATADEECTHYWYGFTKKNFHIRQTWHYTLDPMTLDVISCDLRCTPEDGAPILVRKNEEESPKNNAHDIMTDPHVIALWKMNRDLAGPYAIFLDPESEFASWLRVNY